MVVLVVVVAVRIVTTVEEVEGMPQVSPAATGIGPLADDVVQTSPEQYCGGYVVAIVAHASLTSAHTGALVVVVVEEEE